MIQEDIIPDKENINGNMKNLNEKFGENHLEIKEKKETLEQTEFFAGGTVGIIYEKLVAANLGDKAKDYLNPEGDKDFRPLDLHKFMQSNEAQEFVEIGGIDFKNGGLVLYSRFIEYLVKEKNKKIHCADERVLTDDSGCGDHLGCGARAAVKNSELGKYMDDPETEMQTIANRLELPAKFDNMVPNMEGHKTGGIIYNVGTETVALDPEQKLERLQKFDEAPLTASIKLNDMLDFLRSPNIKLPKELEQEYFHLLADTVVDFNIALLTGVVLGNHNDKASELATVHYTEIDHNNDNGSNEEEKHENDIEYGKYIARRVLMHLVNLPEVKKIQAILQ